MLIKDLFQKDITRDLEGVVTIGNEKEERKIQELEEYVCTEEVTKNLRTFFTNYRKSIQSPNPHCGVWITGFFGSGKSHYLKILSYLLSNETVGGKNAADYFDDKISDSMLLADIKKSAQQNNLVVLFNIDSKAKANAKSSKDSIMETMLNCFNEKIGLSGSNPGLAAIERDLIRQGKYEEFQKEFQAITGKDWKDQRRYTFFLRDPFVKAMAKTTGISEDSARQSFDFSQKNYSITTEEFGKLIDDYCKANNARVIFLIDEVGQFIGSNSNLMLGLQTVVEDLGKFANGKAWVVVTSQQQIDALVQSSNNAMQMDFSKIQGRFATRLTMSSANADEVIKRRLLEKTPAARDYLATVYSQEKNRLNQLLVFPSTPKWSGYADEKQFIDDYPFVNYQSELLQKVFDSIRENGMTEGKSISSGERSLLSAFKKSAEAKCNEKTDILIPFNDFYATAEEFMDYNIKQVFANAKRRMSDPFDVEVLKVLFMLKNVKEMEPTLERLATLMVSSTHDDKAELKKRIKDSLTRLIAETFVQQNGDRFEFLTNEEQDVNRRIKNSTYNQADVLKRVREIVYDQVFNLGKSFTHTPYTFGMNEYIDENLPGSFNPDYLTVKIFTPWEKGNVVFAQVSTQISGCLVIDLTNSNFMEELVEAAKIATFDRNNATGASSTLLTILTKKRAEMAERSKRAENIIRDALSTADYYQNGTTLTFKTTDPKKRFEDAAWKAAVDKFPCMSYVQNFSYKADDVGKALLADPDGGLTGGIINTDANGMAMKEIVSAILDDKRKSKQTSMRSIVDRFSKGNFGWREIDIRVMVAKLLCNGVLKVKERGQVLNTKASEFVRDFSRSSKDEYYSLEVHQEIDSETLNKVRTIMRSSFGVTIPMKESELKDQSLSFFHEKYHELHDIQVREGNKEYPAKAKIASIASLFQSVSSSDDSETLFKNIIQNETSLSDAGTDIDRILGFYAQGGQQLTTWQKAIQISDYYQNNQLFVPGLAKMSSEISKINSILTMEEPFDQIPHLSELVSKAEEIKNSIFEEIKANAKKTIDDCFAEIQKEANEALGRTYSKPDTKQFVQDLLNRYSESFKRYQAIIVSPDRAEQASNKAKDDVDQFRKDLSEIIRKDSAGQPVPAKKVKVIKAIDLIPVADQSVKSKEDIENLVNNLRERLEEYLSSNDEVKIHE